MAVVTRRVATVLVTPDLPVYKSRVNRWGLYLAQRGIDRFLPPDFGLGHRPGAHRIEAAAGTCVADAPSERPAEIPAQLPTRPDPCRRCNEIGHYATVRLTADPDPDLHDPHEGVHEVCPCCAFPQGRPGGLYEEMRAQARTSGHVEVELRQPEGSWI